MSSVVTAPVGFSVTAAAGSGLAGVVTSWPNPSEPWRRLRRRRRKKPATAAAIMRTTAPTEAPMMIGVFDLPPESEPELMSVESESNAISGNLLHLITILLLILR